MNQETLPLVGFRRYEACCAPGRLDKYLILRICDRIAIDAESAGVCFSPSFSLVPSVGACRFLIELVGIFSFLSRAPHPKLARGDVGLMQGRRALFDIGELTGVPLNYCSQQQNYEADDP